MIVPVLFLITLVLILYRNNPQPFRI